MKIELSQAEVEDLITDHISKIMGLDESLLSAAIWMEEHEVRFEVNVKGSEK